LAASHGRTSRRGVTVRAVVFDVGETIVDETRIWSEWADWLGIPRLTFLAVIGAGIKPGGDHRAPFRIFRPDLDLAAERAKREAAGVPDGLRVDDFYPDAVPAIRAVRDAGYRVGVVGNQPSSVEVVLRELDVPLDLVASSASWGVEKPDPAFFARIAEELRLAPAEVAYVGDRLDHDVEPAAAAGMAAIFIRRGPWAWIQAGRTNPPEAAATIEGLGELPRVLSALADRG
jgi:HAD superfamily hydrolase (TIGR01662 family)